MRCAACSWASQTMVMREVSGRSDSPTVSETMLMLRRRKSEATRVRTPGLSWTSATKVWSMFCCPFLVLRCSLRERLLVLWELEERIVRGPAHHLVEGGAGGDHGVDAIFFLDVEVDE